MHVSHFFWFQSAKAMRQPRPGTRLGVLQLEDRIVPTSIQGIAFDDANRNGARDAGEAGLAGWVVFLDVNRDSVQNVGETSTVTNGEGAYFFDTSDETPAQVGTTTTTVRDYVAIALRDGLDDGGRWMNSTATFGVVDRNSEPDAVRNFGAYFQKFEFVGAQPVGPEAAVNAITAGGQGNAAVAADANGNYVVVWSSSANAMTDYVMARVFNADGTARTGELTVGTAKKNNTGYAHPTFVDMNKDGQFVVGWSSYNSASSSYSTSARAFSAGGAPVTATVTVSAGDARNTSFVGGIGMADDGRFAVLFKHETKNKSWVTSRTINVQRFLANGSLSGSAVQVTSLSLVNGAASLAMDATGRFVAVWDEYANGQRVAKAQRYDAAGKMVGGAMTFTAGSVLPNSSVAMNASGQFVITYTTSETTSVARVFRADGTAAFGPVALAGADVTAAIDAAGNATFTWTDNRSPVPGTGYPYYSGEIRVQRLSAIGMLGEELIANTTTAGRQAGSAVAATGNGTFVVVWEGYGLGDDAGVFAQQFAPV